MRRSVPIVFVFSLSFSVSACGTDSADTENPEGTFDTVYSDDGQSMADSTAALDTLEESTDTNEDVIPEDVIDSDDVVNASIDAGGQATCAYPLVILQTGKSDECEGGNEHHWPLNMGPDDCHGWSAVDPTGQTHDNSANAIGCQADGSFSFTQYAGNLNCSGTGTTKTFSPDICEQDIPPVLHTKALNLACCSDLDHPDCVTGVPSVSVPGGTVYLNGIPCD